MSLDSILKHKFTLVKHEILFRLNFKRNLYFYAVVKPANFSEIRCDIPELKGDKYKVWKERILLHLGWMDMDYAIRKDEPPALTNTSTAADITLYERWERSNRLSMMFIKTKISAGIRGSVDQYERV